MYRPNTARDMPPAHPHATLSTSPVLILITPSTHLAGRHQLKSDELEAALLEAGNDLADETASLVLC